MVKALPPSPYVSHLSPASPLHACLPSPSPSVLRRGCTWISAGDDAGLSVTVGQARLFPLESPALPGPANRCYPLERYCGFTPAYDLARCTSRSLHTHERSRTHVRTRVHYTHTLARSLHQKLDPFSVFQMGSCTRGRQLFEGWRDGRVELGLSVDRKSTRLNSSH